MIEINYFNNINNDNILVCNKNTEIDQHVLTSPYVLINGDKQRVKLPLKLGGQLMMNATYNVGPVGAFTQLVDIFDIADGESPANLSLSKKFGFTPDFKSAFATKLSILNGINSCNENLFITTGFEYKTLSHTQPSPTSFDSINEPWKKNHQIQRPGSQYIYQSVLVYAFEFLDYGDNMSLVHDSLSKFIPQMEKLNKGLRFHTIGNKLYFFACLYRNNPIISNQQIETIDYLTMVENIKVFLEK